MPYQEMPRFKAVPDKMWELPQPAIGGINLKDLEFEQEVNQSPYMLNMMYRNGAFAKRYGQNIHSTFEDKIYAVEYYGGDIFVHSGTKIYKYAEDGQHVEIASGLPEEKGLFIIFAQTLYYLISTGFFQYKNNVWGEVEAYVPEVLINCKPDGTGGDVIDDYNIIGKKFSIIYNADGTSTVYKVGPYDGTENESVIDWDVTPVITIDDEETTNFTVDKTAKTVTFTTAPPSGPLNVVMTFTMKPDVLSEERAQILASKYYSTFGGSNNSRLFLAGSGKSKYFWSDAYDISYFPENNFATLGNTEEDITGFGRQYNVLIVFKPKEVYSIYSYVETASTTIIEENIGLEAFKSQLVNARIGCDAPNSIQLINNLLTWFNSNEGVCTLVSTNIVDERNVRIISRNIERTNNFGVKGILDFDEDPLTIQSADYNNRYFLVFPESGVCFMWDYEIAPYRFSNQGETPPKALDWYLFDHFYAGQFIKVDKKLLYAGSYTAEHQDFTKSLIQLNESFSDVNFDGLKDDNGNIMPYAPIHSYYMTPFFQFGAVEYLKNVKNIYVQCRGDTASVIDMYYYTEEQLTPEQEAESIRIGGRLWAKFQWTTFQWFVINHAYTFRRKCNLKKIQMASFFFENNELDRDMSITHIGLQYQTVKYVR